MPRRFVHAADLHLDSPFAGVGTLREGLAERLQESTLAAWDALVDSCLDEQAEFLVLAGDLFDQQTRTGRSEFRVQAGARRLVERGVRVFVAHGNHDPASSRSPLSGIGGVHVFRKDVPETLTEGQHGIAGVAIHGVSFARANEERDLAGAFPDAGSGLDVGVLHCAVGDPQGHGRYAPCTLDTLVRRGYDYWALGHIHAPAILSRAPWVVYSGSLQGRSMKPSDRGAHGFAVVEFDDTGIVSVDQRTLGLVRFEEIQVAVDGLDSTAALLDRALAGAEALRGDAGAADLVVRCRVTGSGALHGDVGRQGWADEFREALAGASPTETVWERVVIETRPDIDYDDLRATPGVIGRLMAAFDDAVGDPAAAAELLGAIESEVSERQAVRSRSAEERVALLERARALALEELLRAEGAAE
jgi:DNA repair exonuclease SbcCD nuclease subunit